MERTKGAWGWASLELSQLSRTQPTDVQVLRLGDEGDAGFSVLLAEQNRMPLSRTSCHVQMGSNFLENG